MGPVNFCLELQTHLKKIHNVFCISVLNKYMPHKSHVLNCDTLQDSKEGTVMVEPYAILYQEVIQLQNWLLEQTKAQVGPA